MLTLTVTQPSFDDENGKPDKHLMVWHISVASRRSLSRLEEEFKQLIIVCFQLLFLVLPSVLQFPAFSAVPFVSQTSQFLGHSLSIFPSISTAMKDESEVTLMAASPSCAGAAGHPAFPLQLVRRWTSGDKPGSGASASAGAEYFVLTDV